MSTDTEILSLPRLYGAPSHKPLRPATLPRALKPADCDDLPIEEYRSPEDQALALQLLPREYRLLAGGGRGDAAERADLTGRTDGQLRGRPLLLRALAGRLLGTPGD